MAAAKRHIPYYRHQYILARPTRRGLNWRFIAGSAAVVTAVVAVLFFWPMLDSELAELADRLQTTPEPAPPAEPAPQPPPAAMPVIKPPVVVAAPPPAYVALPPAVLKPQPVENPKQPGAPLPPAVLRPATPPVVAPPETAKPVATPTTPPASAIPVKPLPIPPVAAPPAQAIAPTAPPLAAPPVAQAEAQKLAAKAREQIAKQQLTSPDQDNAYASYQALAKIAPELAAPVLDEIVLRYLEQGRQYIDAQRFTQPADANAWQTYQKMRQVASDHQATEVLLGEITEGLYRYQQKRLKDDALEGSPDSALAIYQALQDIAPGHHNTAQARQSLLQTLTAKAGQQMEKKEYTTPAGANAHATYRLMQQLDPQNPAALAGVEKIAAEYERLGREYLQQNQPDRSETVLKRGLQVSPRHAGLLALQKELQKQPQEAYRVELDRARRQLAEGKLTQPAGNNAYETYRAILQRDSGHAVALKGIQQVAERYQELARQALDQGDQQRSLALIGEGLAIFPGHAGLSSLKQTLLEQWR